MASKFAQMLHLEILHFNNKYRLTNLFLFPNSLKTQAPFSLKTASPVL